MPTHVAQQRRIFCAPLPRCSNYSINNYSNNHGSDILGHREYEKRIALYINENIEEIIRNHAYTHVAQQRGIFCAP